MKLNLEEIETRVASGLINSVRHRELDYTLYNYTRRTQFDNIWDFYTKTCRGLILDSTGEIIARPFQKIFNLNQTPETRIESLPEGYPKITEKLDGILGILFPEKERPAITTRGEFESEYAKWATEWIRAKGFSTDDFKPEYTYCFEIIYPASKIVVDYGNRTELVLLAVLNNAGHEELDHIQEAEELGITYAKEYPFTEIDDAIEWLGDFKGNEKEGLVMKYSNGLRVKIKSDDYKRIHKVLTGLTVKDIWESLRAGQSLDPILDIVPDEMYDWVRQKESELTAKKNHIMDNAREVYLEATKLSGRKEQAEYVLSHTGAISGVIFKLLNGREDEAEQAAWGLVKPSGEGFKKEAGTES
jgi:RNA ligase